MRKVCAVVGLVFSLILICCRSEAPRAVREWADGVELVHNPDSPLFPDRKVSFVEELSIDGKDEEGNILVYQPGSFALSPEGRFFVSDSQDQRIHIFDSMGGHVKSFGGKGEGPGEFQHAGDIVFLPDGRLMVLDWRARRTSFFDQEGTYLDGYTWRNSHFYVFWCDAMGCTMDDRLYTGEGTTLTVKAFSYKGDELRTLGEFKPAGTHTLQQGNYSFAISLPYDPMSILAGDRLNKKLYHCLNDGYLIEVFDSRGNLVRKIDRPYRPVPFTEEDRQDFFDAFERNPNKVFAQMAKDVKLPAVKTVTESMVVDDKGNLWVQTFETRKEGDQTLTAYDVFNPDGEYMTRTWSHVFPSAFQDGKMYASRRSEEGYRTLVRYKVVWTD